ncbi:MAG: ABC transporter ATP-binding protein [Clostridia bacterium]|nr:ABC transporter ATP-binding protein [Clostridia bacterium]MBQ9507022.1 ABC transporter ATP-binding protein [Clostridia bacterium]
MSNEDREVILSIKHVDVTFHTGHKKKVEAVKNANFDIYKGETFALVGESGSGKTTLGRAIMRINPCSAGEILFEGKRISGKISRAEDRNVVRNIQMIFQDPAASLNERATIDYCVSEGLYNFHLYKNEQDRVEKVDKALKDVGLLPEHKSRYPHEFSGGQRQRVGIARAMIMDPRFIVADEPISALDVSIRAQVLNLMNKLKAEKNLTYLFIAHDLSVVRFIADRIAVIHHGEIVEIAESETLFEYPIHPYTIALLSTVPMPDPIVEKNRKHIVYDPSKLDQSGEKREMRELRPGHFVYCTSKEFAEYEEKISKMEQERNG